jgi:hypothetical protein
MPVRCYGLLRYFSCPICIYNENEYSKVSTATQLSRGKAIAGYSNYILDFGTYDVGMLQEYCVSHLNQES